MEVAAYFGVDGGVEEFADGHERILEQFRIRPTTPTAEAAVAT